MTQPLSGTTMRRNNERLVLAVLRDHSPIARAQIADRLGLTRAAISRIVAGLLERELVEEVGAVNDGSTGRPLTLLRLSHRWAGIGFDARIDRVELIAMQMGGTELRRDPVPMPERPTVDEFIAAVQASVEQVRNELTHEITGVGVAFPGVLTDERRVVKHSGYLGWRDVELSGPLEAALNLPVGLRHVAECAAMANARQPELEGSERLLHIQIGTGLGMALTRDRDLDETLPIGWGGAGHVLLGPPDRQCICGRHGCVDTVVGFDAFARLGRANGLTLGTSHDRGNAFAAHVAEQAAAGVPWAVESLRELREHLSRVIAVFTTIEMPDAVTLGGYPSALGPAFIEALNADIEGHLRSPSPLIETSIGDRASGLGAAMLALAQIARL